MSYFCSVFCWQIVYLFAVPFLMLKEFGKCFLTAVKRDVGGICLKNPNKIDPVKTKVK